MDSGNHAIVSRNEGDNKSITMFFVGGEAFLLQPSSEQAQRSPVLVGRVVHNVTGESASTAALEHVMVL